MPEQTSIFENKIIHETSVDFVTRKVMAKIYLMQYDDSLPVIKVNLLKNGQPFSLPDGAEVSLRYSLRNGPHEEQQGTIDDTDRSVVYFTVNGDMTYYDGPIYPIIKIKIDGQSAGSSYIDILVNRNPVNNEELIPPAPLTLAAVATSGNYNDLKNKPSTYRHVYHTDDVSGISSNYSYIWWDIYSISTDDPITDHNPAYPMTVIGGAYLKNGNGFVKLLVTLNYDGSITVFCFDTYTEATISSESISVDHDVYQINY